MDSMTSKKVMFGFGALLSLLLLIPTTQAAWQPDPAFGLGEAGKFAVLSLGKPTAETLGQSKLDISSVEIFGDVGVGPFGVLDSQGPSIIHGDLYIDPTLLPQDILSDVGTVTGLWYYDYDPSGPDGEDLSGPVAEAIAASEDWSSETPTQTFGRLLVPTTIYSTTEINVINIDGIDYARSKPTAPLELTLEGGENDLFVLNVKGKFVLGPHARILSHEPSRVLINVFDGKVPVQFASDSLIEGTVLTTSRKMGPLQGTSGPIIGARESEISLLGGSTVMHTPQTDPIAVITAPSTVLVDTVATLDGSASTTPSGEKLSYHWSLLERPIGSLTEISDSDPQSPTTYMIPDLPGKYVVELVVDDGELISDPKHAEIEATVPVQQVDLTLTIYDDPDPVVRKETLQYTITMFNQGMSAASDVLLLGSYEGDVRGTPTLSPSDACSFSSATEFNCSLGEIGGLEEVQVELTVIPKAAGTFSASAEVSSLEADADDSNNSYEELTTVLKQ